jgi:two-component system, chemotaxis family, chemotaxis protein CheY
MENASKQILLIEDDSDILDALTELLSMEGFSVQSANNGKEGLDYLQSGADLPKLILVDLMMPIMDGQQFLREKAADKRLQGLPTIVMSADSSFHKNPNILNAAVALVKKPIDIDQFVSTIKKYL